MSLSSNDVCVHHHWQPLHGRIDRQEDWGGSFSSRSSHSSSMDKPQAVCEDKDGGLQCLYYQHIAVWRDTDYICRAGEKAQHIPSYKHPPYPGRWLGHVRRMEDGRIPQDILVGEQALGKRTIGRPHLRYKDVCVIDMKAIDIATVSWEGIAADRTQWRSALKNTSRQGRTNWWLQQRTCEHAERKATGPSDPKPHIYMCYLQQRLPLQHWSFQP